MATGDGAKEVFFRNFFSVLEDAGHFGRWTGLQIMLTSAKYDNFDVSYSGPLSWVVPHLAHVGAKVLGVLVGMRPWYPQYVPIRLRAVAESGGQGSVSQKTE